MKQYLTFFTLILLSQYTFSQTELGPIPCSDEEIMKRQLEDNPAGLEEMKANEIFTEAFIQNLVNLRESRAHDSTAQYIIPVVLHVFHNGDDGKITMEQAQSGLDVLNRDMLGLNSDWEDVSPEFEDIKAPLDVQFCLASIDPDGNPTTGVNYYDDSLGMLNEGDLFMHAWDNFKYMNIYLPKYTGGEPSLFTAYAYYPSLSRVEANIDGVFYSSIRWGYGDHSELDDEQEWASVVTHEVGHWLNLRHTFENGCDAPGDLVDDTPPTLGGTIELSDCDNNDGSCGETTNGENYMDYNHDCKRMFTQGQVDRMTAALFLDARSNLWSLENLIATGCMSSSGTEEIVQSDLLSLYPNPATDLIYFEFRKKSTAITIFDAQGKMIRQSEATGLEYTLNVADFAKGIYFYQLNFEDHIQKGKFIVK